MNAEREQGLARLHLALDIISGLKRTVNYADCKLLQVDSLSQQSWDGETAITDEIRRECVEIVYAFHLEAVRDSDEPDPSDVAYAVLKQIETSPERKLPRHDAVIFEPKFLEAMCKQGLLTHIGGGYIFGPHSRKFIQEYEGGHHAS